MSFETIKLAFQWLASTVITTALLIFAQAMGLHISDYCLAFIVGSNTGALMIAGVATYGLYSKEIKQ